MRTILFVAEVRRATLSTYSLIKFLFSSFHNLKTTRDMPTRFDLRLAAFTPHSHSLFCQHQEVWALRPRLYTRDLPPCSPTIFTKNTTKMGSLVLREPRKIGVVRTGVNLKSVHENCPKTFLARDPIFIFSLHKYH